MRFDYYVYAHQTPEGEVFYVGKGSGKRAFERSSRNKYWKRIYGKHGYKVVFLEWGLSESEAYEKEEQYIAQFRANGLCRANVCDGGAGGISGVYGEQHPCWKDYVTKERLSELYISSGLSTETIAKMFNKSATAICLKLKHWGIERRKPGKKQIKIYCETTKETFDSLNDAARKYGLHRQNILKQIKGQYKTCGGKTFKKL